MTFADAKELERLKVQKAVAVRMKEFDDKRAQIDGTTSTRSGAWHQARTQLAISRIQIDVEDRLAIRKDLTEKCPGLLTPFEAGEFQRRLCTMIDGAFQAILKSLPAAGIRPPAETLSQISSKKSALKHTVQTAVRIMQLEVPQQTSATPFREARKPVPDAPNRFSFQIALSFPGEHRSRVEKIANILAGSFGRERILYDAWHRSEFARPNLDVYLPKLYHEQSLLLVFFLCGAYVQKEWCGLEWRAGRDLLKQRQDDRLMLLRLDAADIPGLYPIDGYLDISNLSNEEVASDILKRAAMLEFSHMRESTSSVPLNASGQMSTADPSFWAQRKTLDKTDVFVKIEATEPRWQIWTRPTEFKVARFKNVDHCRLFVHSFTASVPSQFPYPWLSGERSNGELEHISGETDTPDGGITPAERWILFRSGQLVQNRSISSRCQPNIHVLDVLN